MRFVAKTLGVGDGEKALIDLRWEETGRGRDNRSIDGGRPDLQITSILSPIPSDQILAATIVA
jgi:hypothetical protein